MKYLAGLIVGLGLMAHGQAFASYKTFFEYDYSKPENFVAPSLRPCIDAAEDGIELVTITQGEVPSKSWLYKDKVYLLMVAVTIDAVEDIEQIMLQCTFMSPK